MFANGDSTDSYYATPYPDLLFYLLLCYMAATLIARCFTDLLHII